MPAFAGPPRSPAVPNRAHGSDETPSHRWITPPFGTLTHALFRWRSLERSKYRGPRSGRQRGRDIFTLLRTIKRLTLRVMPAGPSQPDPTRGPIPDHYIRLGPGVTLDPAALRYSYDTSPGPGGQNANKSATRARLRVSLADIPLTPAARGRLANLGQRWIVPVGAGPDDPAAELVFVSSVHRSQRQNTAECLDRLRSLVLRALTPPKARKPTRPSRGAVERRLKAKTIRSEQKRRRRPPERD